MSEKFMKKLFFTLLIILSLFMPLREFLAIYVHEFTKFLPDILIFLMLITYCIYVKFKIKLNYLDYFFLAFLIIGFLSSIFNNVSVIATIMQIRSISVMYCLFFLMRKIHLPKKNYLYIFNVIIVISIFIMFLGLGEYLFDKRLFFPGKWALSITYESNFNRIYGLLNNPNNLAMYVFLMNLLFVYKIIKIDKKIKIFYWFYCLLSIFVIFLTASRSTFILTIIALVILFVLFVLNKQKNKSLILVSVLCCAFILNSVFSNVRLQIIETIYDSEKYYDVLKEEKNNDNYENNDKVENGDLTDSGNDNIIVDNKINNSFISRFLELFSGKTLKDSKVDGRLYNVYLGMNIFLDHPLIGTGFGTFGSAGSMIAGSNLTDEYNISNDFYTDNEYIKVLVEGGLIGGFVYCIFLICLGLMCLNNGYKLFLYFSLIFMGMFYNIFEVQLLMFYIYFTFVFIEVHNKKLDLNKLNKVYNDSKIKYYEKVANYLNKGKKRMIVTANPETMKLFDNDEIMQNVFEDENVDIIPDGIGIVISSRIVGNKVKERITGVDLVEYLLKEGNKQNKSVYFFGAKQEVIDSLVNVCKEKYPSLKIVGAQNGYVKDRDAIFKDIIKKKPDICFVALGIPHQEKLIYKFLDKFDKGIFVGVGGSFDVLSGLKQRAPKFFIKLNLEWLYRIACEPKRLKRFYNNNIKYVSDVLNNDEI